MRKIAGRVAKVKAESLGLDVHQGMTAFCLLGRNGDEVEAGRIEGGRGALEALLDRVVGRKKTHVSLEACGGSLWVFDLLVERYGKGPRGREPRTPWEVHAGGDRGQDRGRPAFGDTCRETLQQP